MQARSIKLCMGLQLPALLLAAATAAAQTEPPEMLVTNVGVHFAADRGGIEAGDVLTGWSVDSVRPSPRDETPFVSPFDVYELEREVHPISPVTLHGVRSDEPISLTLAAGRWRLSLKPRWPDSVDIKFAEVESAVAGDDIDQAIALATDLAATLRKRELGLDAAWVLWRVSVAAARKRRHDDAIGLYDIALAGIDPANHARETALIKSLRGRALMNAGRFDAASTALLDAIAAERKISENRMSIARNQLLLASAMKRQQDITAARSTLEEALWLQERLAPGSFAVAQTLNQLGYIAIETGNNPRAEAYFERALALAEAYDAGGVAVGGYANSLGLARYFQGDLQGAEQLIARAANIKARLEPGSPNVAATLHNLGLMQLERGKFRDAQAHYLAALEISESRDPASLTVARTLNNLGSVALDQGDVEQAAYYHRRALKIKQQQAPQSVDLAVTLTNLGNVERQRGRLKEAEQHCAAAQDIHQQIAPAVSSHAVAWSCLGATAEKRGDHDLAINRFLESLRIHRDLAPRGAGVAETATRLGHLALGDNDREAAADYFDLAHVIVARLAPGTFREARALHGLAEVKWLTGNTGAALEAFEQSIAALEAQDGKAGGNQVSRASVHSRHHHIYSRFIELLLELDLPERAFEILERSRSKVLRDLLSQRSLAMDADIPADMAREQRILAYQYEKKQAELLSAKTTAEVDEMRVELFALRDQRERLQQRIREERPDFQAPTAITPSDFDSLRRTIPQDAAVLSYSVAEAGLTLFIVSENGVLDVMHLPAEREYLEQAVQRFRLLMDAGRWDKQPSDSLTQLSRELYAELLAPAEDYIANASQILVMPDGPLRVLPFAALQRTNGAGQTQYVSEWKPILVADSLGVLAQLERRRRPQREDTLVAFGSPDYSMAAALAESNAPGMAIRSAIVAAEPIPWSAEEITSIGKQYPGDTTIYVDKAASETNAKGLSKGVKHIHFAAHTHLDSRQPLDSAVVLSLPDEQSNSSENGYLQAWEIIEQLRIDADLVVLSGCETALGAAFSGEGIIGLTRAFQYAGAASVMSSLWRVDDQSTSRLMSLFYQEIAAGKSPALALQQAQIRIVEESVLAEGSILARLKRWFAGNRDHRDFSHPYHWAGFTVNGLAL
ncbi:MAG: CHAT domain-containing protein [Pseudomonadota bacterium]